jgi:hypothetical protein
MAEAALPFSSAVGAGTSIPARSHGRFPLEDAIGGVLYLVAAGAATALAVVALTQGGRIDRDIAALAGEPVRATPADFGLLVGVGAALVLGTMLARRVVFDEHVKPVAAFASVAACAAIGAEVVGMIAAAAGWIMAAQVAGVIAVSAALPAVPVAAVGVLLGGSRLMTFFRAKDRSIPEPVETAAAGDQGLRPATATAPADREPSPTDSATQPQLHIPVSHQRARWRRGYVTGDSKDPARVATGTEEAMGICLSGGGIRAASVALGALQDKDFRNQALTKAKFLVSVSGSSYTAGAFQQALTGALSKPLKDGTVSRQAQHAFAEGSAEEDHVRRNASYIARNPAETLAVLGLLAKHLVLNLLLLFGPAIVLGVLAAWLYPAIGITDLDPILNVADEESMMSGLPEVSTAAWIAMATLAGLVCVCWLFTDWFATHAGDSAGADARATNRRSARWRVSASVTRRLGGLFWTVGIVAVAVPTVIWASAWVMRLSPFDNAVPASIGTVLLTYVSSLAALLWRKRTNLKQMTDSMQVPAAVPRGFGQLLLVVLALTALGVGWLLVFGGVAAVTLGNDRTVSTMVAAVMLAVVIGIGAFVDVTSLSLHPFYRRRLARAFAVRSVERANGEIVAKPYDPMECTTLSTYGTTDSTAGAFPEVIFAASATIGGTKTPSGSNRVSYIFSSRYVGGPEVGYYATKDLEAVAPSRLQRDLTVQGAVALSGAAIATSVGTQNANWYETLFAATGIRLGAWMPNPNFLKNRADGPRKWYEPGLPKVRRMSYLLRELFGLHPADAPLVQVTDGGFYDNLGLIELFRRRCTTIYCIDASGDNPPPAWTLAKVASLAYQELGVEIDLASAPFATTPGTGEPTPSRQGLTSLTPRMSKTGVMTATFLYPEDPGGTHRLKGTLVVAKASLWPELPYPLQAYAMRNPTFPHDSTTDQWFDDGQYSAYTALGRHLGAASVAAMTAARPVSQAASTDSRPR